jgi:hypothetical protein
MSKIFFCIIVIACMMVNKNTFASITVYTSEAAFLGAISAPGIDGYNGFSISGTTPSPIFRGAGAYTYTGTAPTSAFFGAGTTANPWLSTNNATDTIIFSNFTNGVIGAGGIFFCSTINGTFTSGAITVVASDSLGATSTQTINGATISSFLAFVSTGALTSLSITSAQTATPIWPTVDNLTLGVARFIEDMMFADGFE